MYSYYLCLQINPETLARILFIIFILVIPLLVIITSALYILRSEKLKKQAQESSQKWEEALAQLGPLSSDNLRHIDQLMAEEDNPELSHCWQNLREDSQQMYGQRWLANPATYITPQRLESLKTLNLMSWRPTLLIFSIALLAAVFIFTYLSTGHTKYQAGWALVTLAIGLVCSAFVHNSCLELRCALNEKYDSFYQALGKVVPIYDTQKGVSVLIDEMLRRESTLGQSIQKFTESAEKMADSEFSEGICRSVRQIMNEELTPPIARAGRVLSDLAVNLDKRQMTGMENLSEEFSAQLASKLSLHLTPLKEELRAFNQVVFATRQYMNEAVDSLNSNREHNIQLNREISESLRLMTLAKNDLANELAEVSDQVAIMSKTGAEMSRSFAGEEDNLSDKIKDLTLSLNEALQVFSKGLKASSESIELASKLKIEQEKQHEDVTIQLSRLIANIEELDRSLRNAANNFTTESSSYVNETLASFDEGLAEVVERLIFTSSALREAVDSLPQSLKEIAPKEH